MLRKLIRYSHLSLAPPLRDERGATLAEYGLVLTMVAVAMFALVYSFGSMVVQQYQLITQTIAGAWPY